MKYSVYFLISQKDNKLYIGCTSRNPQDRLKEHNLGMVTSTKNRRPFKLIYFEEYKNKKLAYKREWLLKHPKGYQDKISILKRILGP
jgi:putative endonuclease